MFQVSVKGASELNAAARYMRVSAHSPWLEWQVSSAANPGEIYKLAFGDILDLEQWGRRLYVTPFPAVAQVQGRGNELPAGAVAPAYWDVAYGQFDFADNVGALVSRAWPSPRVVIEVEHDVQVGAATYIKLAAFQYTPMTRRIRTDGTFNDSATNSRFYRLFYDVSETFNGFTGGVGTVDLTVPNDFSGTTNFAISLSREVLQGYLIAWEENTTGRGPARGSYLIGRSSTDGQ